ncbi:hypothetical protein F0L74_09675 [Chitinophaga agrisoli]|uniref:Uncharacterized protein n=1 Tax=Chitinophaga agrisoli TaxID=2607653 RepID=A0A5B2VX00_9BACT|nr:hypothetical protein [Chitinophaga agrisoli]KAA2242787.1 hypothetical protein F0L74_09675 [Chitinophaga agrisoli]
MKPWIKIRFDYVEGDTRLPAQLAETMHCGGRLSFQLLVNNYYWGEVFQRQGEWVWPDRLHGDDIAGLVDRMGDVYYLRPEDMY